MRVQKAGLDAEPRHGSSLVSVHFSPVLRRAPDYGTTSLAVALCDLSMCECPRQGFISQSLCFCQRGGTVGFQSFGCKSYRMSSLPLPGHPYVCYGAYVIHHQVLNKDYVCSFPSSASEALLMLLRHDFRLQVTMLASPSDSDFYLSFKKCDPQKTVQNPTQDKHNECKTH